jgi:hypothetical protein
LVKKVLATASAWAEDPSLAAPLAKMMRTSASYIAAVIAERARCVALLRAGGPRDAIVKAIREDPEAPAVSPVVETEGGTVAATAEEDFMGTVRAYRKAHGVSLSAAMRQVATKQPDLHAAFLSVAGEQGTQPTARQPDFMNIARARAAADKIPLGQAVRLVRAEQHAPHGASL